MSHQVLARKWRPQSFQEVAGQPHIVRALSNALEQQYLHHAYLLTGTRGVGKTTIARIIAKCLNCEAGISATPCGTCSTCQEIDAGRFVDLYEVDAASRTKVEDTRELLDNAQYAPTKGRFKIYLIDEVHMLSGHSFNALLKTLEEPPEHVKFLLATTDPQRLPATVLSRCLQFHLSAIAPEIIAEYMQQILAAETITFEQPAIDLLAQAANGSMRDGLSLLDQSIAFGNGSIAINDVKAMLGTIDPKALLNLLHALSTQNATELLEHIEQLAQLGTDFSQALADLLSLLHNVALLHAVPEQSSRMSDELQTLAKQIKPEDVQLYYQIGIIGRRDLPFAPTARTGFEMTLLRMLAFSPEQQGQNLTKTTAKTIAPSTPTANAQQQSSAQNWDQLLKSLNLKGATLALAQQCSLKQRTQNELYLLLAPNQKPLLNPKYVERIQQALCTYLNQKITVHIELTTSNVESPAALAAKQQQQKQADAVDTILNDDKVQKIMQTFDATLVEDSITSIH